MDERKAGITTATWPIIAQSFFPDAGDLAAAEQDVLQPWTAPRTRLFTKTFGKKAARVWWIPLATPLDGNVARQRDRPERGQHGRRRPRRGEPADRPAARGVGGSAGEAPRRVDLRPAIDVRARYPDGPPRQGARLGDDCVRRTAAGGALVAVLACVRHGGGRPRTCERACAPALVDVRARRRERRAGCHRCHLVRVPGHRRPRAERRRRQPDPLGVPHPVRRGGQPRLRRTGDAGGRRADRRLVARPGLDARAAERRGDVPLCDAARHHDRPVLASGLAAGAARRPLLAHLRHARAGGPHVAVHEVPRLLRRPVGRGQRLRPGRRATIRTDSGSPSSSTAPASGSRPRPSRRTSSCTRREPSRTGRRMRARATPAGTRATATWTSCTRSSGGTSSRRRCSIPDGTTTTGTPAGGRTRRTPPGSLRLDGQAPLALAVAGPGSVDADVPGLECSASCSTTWNAGQRLVLTATPGAGAKLVRWGGACSGSGACSVTVAAGTAVSALFAPAAFRLTVRVAGRGSVRSSGGIQCRPGAPRPCRRTSRHA